MGMNTKRKNVHSTIQGHLKQQTDDHFYEAVKGDEHWRLRLRVRQTLEVESQAVLPRLAMNAALRERMIPTRRVLSEAEQRNVDGQRKTLAMAWANRDKLLGRTMIFFWGLQLMFMR